MTGTKVQNPVARRGQTGYRFCPFCKGKFTSLGMGKHIQKCKARAPSSAQLDDTGEFP